MPYWVTSPLWKLFASKQCQFCTACTSPHTVSWHDIPANSSRFLATLHQPPQAATAPTPIPCTGGISLHVSPSSQQIAMAYSPRPYILFIYLFIKLSCSSPIAATAILCTGGISLTVMRYYMTLAASETCMDILPQWMVWQVVQPVQLFAAHKKFQWSSLIGSVTTVSCLCLRQV